MAIHIHTFKGMPHVVLGSLSLPFFKPTFFGLNIAIKVIKIQSMVFILVILSKKQKMEHKLSFQQLEFDQIKNDKITIWILVTFNWFASIIVGLCKDTARC